MDEYIEREALYEKAYWHGEHPDVGNPFSDGVDAIDIKDVDAIPAADVAPVRHGEWVPLGQRTYGGGRSYTHYCNRCGQHGYDDYVLCPNCGSKMDGGED